MARPLEQTSNDLIRSLLFHEPVGSGVDGVFRAMGAVHLFTASGIHLLALFFWLELILKRSGETFQIPIRRIKAAGLAGFLAVSLLVWKNEGFHPSLFRPLLSVLIRLGLREAGFRTPVLLPLVVVLLFEALISLRTGVSPGAIHYYLAVGGSLLALARSGAKERGLALHLRMSVYSWVPIAVLDLWRDHRVVPSTPLLSLLSIPPVSLVLYPLTLLGRTLTGGIPECIRTLWILFMNVMVRVLDFLPGGFSVPRAPVLIGGILSIVILFSARRSRRFLLPLTIGVIALRFLMPEASETRFVQLDVGQGDSAILQKSGRTEMVDLGSGRVQTPERMVRLLGRYGVDRVEGVLFTHLDEDHIGALPVLLALSGVRCIEMGEHHREDERGKRILEWMQENHPGIPVLSRGCIRNGRVAWFGSDREGAKGNEWMAGIASTFADRVYLALGDGDSKQEEAFTREFSFEIFSRPHRVWKVGHHGSRFSSDFKSLTAMRPDEFWISVGRRNRYHHPAPATLARLSLMPGRVRRTDQEGDLDSGMLE